jgi:hypothetical protein
MSNNVLNVLNSCSRNLYVLKTLRAHDLPAVAPQNVYRSVILAKVMFASSAWSGFISQTDRLRIDSFLQMESTVATAQLTFRTLRHSAKLLVANCLDHCLSIAIIFFRGFFLIGLRHCCITDYAVACTADNLHLVSCNFINWQLSNSVH